MRSIRRKILACLFLAAITLVAYMNACGNQFVNYDDTIYVTDNFHLKEGFTWDGLRWAWTDFLWCMWNPMTRMSFLLDYSLFGMNPWGYHLHNVLLHLANVLLLYGVLRRLTGAAGRSLVVAALWAVHPLRVESVAWVTERKDVLSTFFALITLWLYVRYTERQGAVRYLLVCFVFVLSLLAKPMLVTLPFVLLLLDYWPLSRLRPNFGEPDHAPQANGATHSVPWRKLIWEKLPLFAIAMTFGAVTAVSHKEMGAFRDTLGAGFLHRTGSAIVAYVQYLSITLWPKGLAIVYPYPYTTLSIAQVLGAGLVLIGISLVVIYQTKARPYLLVGWLWYLGTLVPVLGIVKVTNVSYADRYTYVPHIGLFVMVIWPLAEFFGRYDRRRLAAALATGAALAPCMVLTYQQVGHWRNSMTLWVQTLAVTTENSVAQINYGTALMHNSETIAQAKQHLFEAIRINPTSRTAHLNLAILYSLERNLVQAEKYYLRTLQLDPDYSFAHGNLGMCQLHMGKTTEALEHLDRAIQLNPEFADAHVIRGVVLDRLGKREESDQSFARALAINAANAKAHCYWAQAWIGRGNPLEAKPHFAEAVRLDPNDAESSLNLGLILGNQGELAEAERYFHMAIERRPDYGEARFDFGILLERRGQAKNAELQFNVAVQLMPGCAEAHDNLGMVLELQGKLEDAMRCYQQALRIKPNLVDARCNLAGVLYDLGQTEQAATQYREAGRTDRNWTAAANEMAWDLANNPDVKKRNAVEALRIARQVCQATANSRPQFLMTLASCYAEAGRTEQAAATARRALDLTSPAFQSDLHQAIQARLQVYESRASHRSVPTRSSNEIILTSGTEEPLRKPRRGESE